MPKKRIILSESELKDYIKESVKEHLLLEMATFGTERWGNNTYRIAVHGASTKDRPIPHIHIYLNQDVQPYKQFNFEISLVDILCKDEINLIFQMDRKNNIKNTNRVDCTWTGYADIYYGIKTFLSSPSKSKKYGMFIDNLDRAIYEWNRETDFIKTENGGNPLKEYLDEKGLTVLPQYMKYFE
jgi:hypothetical protein